MLLLSDAIKQYEQHLRAKRRSPRTLTWYTEQFAAYRAWRAAQVIPPADELPEAEIIDTFLADQHEAGLAPSTVHARFRALRALFRFLERRKKITHDQNPFHVLDAPGVPTEVRRYVTAEDLNTLLAVITGQTWLDHRDRVILLILFYSGLRLSELCGLHVHDVDMTSLEVTVHRGKGDKARVVPCAPDVRPALAAYLYTRPSHIDELLLKSDGYGGAAGVLRPEGVRQMLIRRCKQAGIEPYSPHAFRHGFAMWLLNAGARATTVATAMGHSDPQITLAIYAHTTVTTVRREYDEALSKRSKRS
jgi:integrase/recombinase XerC